MKVSSPVFRLKVIIKGKPIQEYNKDTNVFIEGRKGSNFELELTNLTGRRLLVHPTVDGLSAMTGKEASRTDNTHGYVLAPFQTARIPGWRLNDSEVAKFFFSGEGKSYAEKIGKGADKGVIAAAIWEEMLYTWNFSTFTSAVTGCVSNDYTSWNVLGGGSHTADASPISEVSYTCSAAAAPRPNVCRSRMGNSASDMGFTEIGESKSSQNLGTGFGRRAEHQTARTAFTPAQTEPNLVAVIYYDDLRGLKARGIRISNRSNDQGLPNPFPKDPTGCAPPAGWTE